MDATIGANRKAIASATRRVESIPAGKQRFQQGGIDEISFLGMSSLDSTLQAIPLLEHIFLRGTFSQVSTSNALGE